MDAVSLSQTQLHKCYHRESYYLLRGASHLKGVNDRRENHNTFVTPISNIGANEKVHEQEHTPLNWNVSQIKTRLVTAPRMRL